MLHCQISFYAGWLRYFVVYLYRLFSCKVNTIRWQNQIISPNMLTRQQTKPTPNSTSNNCHNVKCTVELRNERYALILSCECQFEWKKNQIHFVVVNYLIFFSRLKSQHAIKKTWFFSFLSRFLLIKDNLRCLLQYHALASFKLFRSFYISVLLSPWTFMVAELHSQRWNSLII